MSLKAWVISYLLNLAFWWWVLLGGGAERLEGTFTSGLLLGSFTPNWSADGIKLFGWATLILTTIVFLLGLFSPGWRVLHLT